MDLIERFLSYVKVETTSDETTEVTPSTPGQMAFAKQLHQELISIGLSDVTIDDNGYVYATLPANTDKADVPVIGFIAHMDTAPDYCGKNIKPQIIPDYDGKDVALSDSGLTLKINDFPSLFIA